MDGLRDRRTDRQMDGWIYNACKANFAACCKNKRLKYAAYIRGVTD